MLDDRRDEEMGLIERAIKASVVIGAMDSRGLYTQIPGGDASTRVSSTQSIPQKIAFQAMETAAQEDIMASLAQELAVPGIRAPTITMKGSRAQRRLPSIFTCLVSLPLR